MGRKRVSKEEGGGRREEGARSKEKGGATQAAH
jgi:hypothetical protein